jgi:hypothetical protein
MPAALQSLQSLLQCAQTSPATSTRQLLRRRLLLLRRRLLLLLL